MVSNIQEIAAKSAVRELNLPGWEPGEVFVCKVRRAQMYELAREGFVPNPLMDTISKMFISAPAEVGKIPLEDQAKAIRQIAKYSLVEPTLEEIETAGLRLTDAQMEALYAYAIGGTLVVAAFLGKKGGSAGVHGADVPRAAKQVSGDT